MPQQKKKKSQNRCGFETFLELLARFELATSSLPTTFGTSQGTSANHIEMRKSIDNTRA